MKTMKRIAAFACVLILILSMLAGCKSDGGAKGVKVIPIPLTEEEYAFGVDKNQPELLEQANAYIAKIIEDGAMDSASCILFSASGERSDFVSTMTGLAPDCQASVR